MPGLPSAIAILLDSAEDTPSYSKTAPDQGAPLGQYSCWTKH